jgi:hypothetical protein
LSTDSFQSVTLWSPEETARTLPVVDQLKRHTGMEERKKQSKKEGRKGEEGRQDT